ncbi:G2/mitotic-specific cyclin-1-like [Lactuca sativa]|uniref:G2/mitotic-specific cyclin-1-like n=1 Tax=Lactuca sativa TaxID=4236 RepID=UPI001C68A968|nr:G2/mitotic-specific cyclin-1-like [Lactuca sativa]
MKIKIKMFLTCKGNEEGNKNIWYFDNGASNHICGYKDLFMKLDKTVGDVSFGDLSTILIKGKDVKEKKILSEISNLTAITRPNTRSLRAQLITNAIPKNQKTKPPPVPQNATVIKISPNTEELKKPKSWSSQNKSPQSSLTSTLTARSKVAYCPKQENFVDIDAQDVDNELAAVEYVEDIYIFHKLVENETRVNDYMHTQPKMTEKKRESLIDWMIEARDAFMNETLYLTINIGDIFLASKTAANRELRCVGVVAMFIASKYVEMLTDPMVYDFVEILNNQHEKQDVLVMEKWILSQLEWSLTVPTPYVFLTSFLKAAASITPLEIEVE